MLGGNKDEFEQYIRMLKQQFDQDPSILYRRSCQNKISNFDFLDAISDAYSALFLKPTVIENYLLFPKIILHYLRSVAHVLSKNNA
jgi:hypothetical protein